MPKAEMSINGFVWTTMNKYLLTTEKIAVVPLQNSYYHAKLLFSDGFREIRVAVLVPP